MSENNNEPQSQQEAWKRAQEDHNRGLPPANTQTWNNDAAQNYNNQYHWQNNNQGK